MEHILLYKWALFCEDSISKALQHLGFVVDVISGQMINYDHDINMENVFDSYFLQCEENGSSCIAVFSIDYFPLISNIFEKRKIPYISWFVDYPMATMYSKTIHNQCNKIFVFDEMQYEELVNLGVKNAFHMPLATDIFQWQSIEITQEDTQKYLSDVSFLGNLYNDSIGNKYNSIHTFPDYIKGYLDGIVDAQLKVYGYNFVESTLNHDILEEVRKYLEMDLGPLYFDVYEKLLTDIINRQISMLERRNVLNMVGSKYNLNLYTSSDTSAISAKKVTIKGYVDYMTVMPKIFKLSKINLNITSKSIKSGISLRVLDVLGMGGFLISNYQPEIAQYFENGVEVVMYESMEDLDQKIEYYLTHEDERKMIARAGYNKVKTMFSYEAKLTEILQLSGIIKK